MTLKRIVITREDGKQQTIDPGTVRTITADERADMIKGVEADHAITLKDHKPHRGKPRRLITP